jgi:hypothetical protein
LRYLNDLLSAQRAFEPKLTPFGNRTLLDFIRTEKPGAIKLLKAAATLTPGIVLSFEPGEGISIDMSKHVEGDDRHVLDLKPKNMRRSSWFSLEVECPRELVTRPQVLIAALRARCLGSTSVFVTARAMLPGGDWLECASPEIDLTATDEVRSFPIIISEAWSASVAECERVLLMVFFEARDRRILLEDFKVFSVSADNFTAAQRPGTIQHYLASRSKVDPLHCTMDVVSAETVIGRGDIACGGRLVGRTHLHYQQLSSTFPKAELVHDENGTALLHIDLTPTRQSSWRTLYSIVPYRPGATAMTYALRAQASETTRVRVILRHFAGGDFTDYPVFNLEAIGPEATTIADVARVPNIVFSGDPEECHFIAFLDTPVEWIRLEHFGCAFE